MSKPHWDPMLPTEPGRYFYRDRQSGEYGTCLVAWSRGFAHGDSVRQPSLDMIAQCIMGYDSSDHWRHPTGENSDHPNWSYSHRVKPEGLVFWTVPLATPDFPEISGRPPDVGPAVIKKEKAKSAARAKASKKREREQAQLRKKAIAQAVKDDADLHECESCDARLRPEDQVVGKLRGCPHCSTEFVEGDDGRHCPDCNRTFTSLVEEKHTCPDCRDGGELPDLVIVVEGGVPTPTGNNT